MSAHQSSNEQPTNSESDWKRTFELFKLEYEQATQRYENIYRDIWQIFQYMALLSAGILTFASKDSRFPTEVIVFIALLPLVFWFSATYLPMDQYGQGVRKRLIILEQRRSYEIFNDAIFCPEIQEWRKPEQKWRGWRVRRAIVFFGVLILSSWIFSGILIFLNHPTYHQYIVSFFVISILISIVGIIIDKCLEK